MPTFITHQQPCLLTLVMEILLLCCFHFQKHFTTLSFYKTYEDLIVPRKSQMIVFSKPKFRSPNNAYQQPNFVQATQLLVQCSSMQQQGKGFLWIPYTVVSTMDSDKIPIVLLNLTNCSLKISNKQFLTHAQRIGDCVTNIMDLLDNPLEVKSASNSTTPSSSLENQPTQVQAV